MRALLCLRARPQVPAGQRVRAVLLVLELQRRHLRDWLPQRRYHVVPCRAGCAGGRCGWGEQLTTQAPSSVGRIWAIPPSWIRWTCVFMYVTIGKTIKSNSHCVEPRCTGGEVGRCHRGRQVAAQPLAPELSASATNTQHSNHAQAWQAVAVPAARRHGLLRLDRGDAARWC